MLSLIFRLCLKNIFTNRYSSNLKFLAFLKCIIFNMLNIQVNFLVCIILNLLVINVVKLNVTFLDYHYLGLRIRIGYLISFPCNVWRPLSVLCLDVWINVLIVFMLKLDVRIRVVQLVIWVQTAYETLVSEWLVYFLFLLRIIYARISTWI